VSLNGRPLGTRWYGRRRFALTDGLMARENSLEVRVTTLAFNHFRAHRHDPMAQYWMSRSRTDGPLPTGLLGPVRLLRPAK
jgi:hypothetical protein